MEITGKIIVALPEVTGVSKAGKSWKKREYVLETIGGNFPSKVFFNFFGDRADQYPLKEGQVVKISFDINSREFNGRWYTDISAWRAEDVTVDGAAATAAPAQGVVDNPPNPYGIPPLSANLSQSNPTDDLPF